MQSSSTASAIVPIVERYKAVTTIAEAFNLAEPAIATLAKERGLEKVQKAFRLQFARFAADLHIKDTLNESDIDFIVEALTTDDNYKWLKTADIAILFKRIRMNKYGKLYQAMNTGTFFECLDKYCAERNGEIENIRAQEAQEFRRDMRGEVKLPYFINAAGKIEWTDEEKQRLAEEQRRKDELEAETMRKREVVQQLREQLLTNIKPTEQ